MILHVILVCHGQLYVLHLLIIDPYPAVNTKKESRSDNLEEKHIPSS